MKLKPIHYLALAAVVGGAYYLYTKNQAAGAGGDASGGGGGAAGGFEQGLLGYFDALINGFNQLTHNLPQGQTTYTNINPPSINLDLSKFAPNQPIAVGKTGIIGLPTPYLTATSTPVDRFGAAVISTTQPAINNISRGWYGNHNVSPVQTANAPLSTFAAGVASVTNDVRTTALNAITGRALSYVLPPHNPNSPSNYRGNVLPSAHPTSTPAVAVGSKTSSGGTVISSQGITSTPGATVVRNANGTKTIYAPGAYKG